MIPLPVFTSFFFMCFTELRNSVVVDMHWNIWCLLVLEWTYSMEVYESKSRNIDRSLKLNFKCFFHSFDVFALVQGMLGVFLELISAETTI